MKNCSIDKIADKKPFVSVIIPVYNDSERLQKCLSRVCRQTYPWNRYEVIVVDNCSDDGIRPVVERYKGVKLLYEHRTGSYAARNLGIQHSKGEILAFTDSDCIPATNWIDKGVTNLTNVNNCGLVGGKIDFIYKNPFKPTIAELFDSTTFLQQKRCIQVAHFSVTANLLTFKKVFEQVGLFNPRLKSGGDFEWGQRVFKSGFNLHYAENTVVEHPARFCLRQMCKKVIRVNRGLYFLGNPKRGVFYNIIEIIRNDLLPPVSRIHKSLNDDRFYGYSQKIKIVLGILIFKYVVLIDNILIVLSNLKRKFMFLPGSELKIDNTVKSQKSNKRSPSSELSPRP